MSTYLKKVLMVGLDLKEHEEYKDINIKTEDEETYEEFDYIGQMYKSNEGKVTLFLDYYNGETLIYGKVFQEVRDDNFYNGGLTGVIEYDNLDEIKEEVIKTFKDTFGHTLHKEHLKLRLYDFYT